jgi:hypothetical protein
MHLTQDQVLPALRTNSWKQIRFTNGFHLRRTGKDMRDDSAPLRLTNAEGNVVVVGDIAAAWPHIEGEEFVPCCSWCQSSDGSGAPATEQLVDGMLVCDRCKPSLEKYYRCSMCGCELPANIAFHNRDRFQEGPCSSPKCLKAQDVKFGRLCCMKAEKVGCVCAYAYKCPEHAPNTVHVGTHD